MVTNLGISQSARVVPLLRVPLALAVALVSMVSCASAYAELNLTGTWSANYHCEAGACAGTDIPATDRLFEAEGSSTVTGTNGTETIEGTLTGDTFTYHGTTGAYKAEASLTVAADGLSWSGPLQDSNLTNGTYTARRDPPPAGAVSQLPSPSNCVGIEGSSCGTLIPSGLESQTSLVVSPDGRNVYSVASNALIEFSRDQATGALTEIGCVTGSTIPCAPEHDASEAQAMNDPAAIAISPNGANVYVTAEEAGAVVTFSREAGTGLLAETGCVSHSIASGCTNVGARGLKEPGAVRVSADERSLYVTSFGEQAVAEFERDTTPGPEEGTLKQLAAPNECISSEPSSKCKAKAVGLEEASSVALSPEGKDVYVAAVGTGTSGSHGGDIAEFERDTTAGPEDGALKQLSGANACLTSTGVTGCANVEHINGPGELVVSPDEQNVYANSFAENAILEFSRESSGQLKQLAGPNTCISSSATTPTGCTAVKGIEGPFGMAISPEGSNLYVAGIADNAIAVFERNTSGGELTQFAAPYECITENASGCGTNNAVGLKNAWLPVVSPDGANVYVGGESGQLVELARSRRLGGLNIAGYCETLGYDGTGSGSTTLLRGAVEGPEYAYENWACVRADGTTVPIAVSGAAPSMNDACAVEFPGGAASYAYPEDPNSAYTWNCYTLLPVGEEKEAVKEVEGGSGSGGGESTAKVASLVAPIPSIAPITVPPPVLARTANVALISGKVLVRIPGSNTFVPLASLRQIPFGSVIEATHGHVSVTTAQPNGTTQTGEFFEGEFVLRQGRNGQVVAELTGGNFSVCPTARERAHKARATVAAAASSGKHVVRKLWANAHGSFSTKGNYAAGAVQGTEWLTEDLCEGTIIRVTRDKVAVTNLVNHRHVEVTTGHKYLAKAP